MQAVPAARPAELHDLEVKADGEAIPEPGGYRHDAHMVPHGDRAQHVALLVGRISRRAPAERLRWAPYTAIPRPETASVASLRRAWTVCFGTGGRLAAGVAGRLPPDWMDGFTENAQPAEQRDVAGLGRVGRQRSGAEPEEPLAARGRKAGASGPTGQPRDIQFAWAPRSPKKRDGGRFRPPSLFESHPAPPRLHAGASPARAQYCTGAWCTAQPVARSSRVKFSLSSYSSFGISQRTPP